MRLRHAMLALCCGVPPFADALDCKTLDTRMVVQRDGFGYYDYRPASRPYGFLPDSYLDDWQRDAIKRWEAFPYNLIWVYAIEPGPENNWAGWGPPPPDWTTRRDIPRTKEGAYMGSGLPWPPPGKPRGGWVGG